MTDNHFFEDEVEPIKTLTLTKNELLYLDDSVTMLIEPDSNLPLPFRPLVSQALISIPSCMMEKLGRGVFNPQDKPTTQIELSISELYILREICLSYVKINGEAVGYNLKRKIYQALLSDEVKEEEDLKTFETLLNNANVDMSAIE